MSSPFKTALRLVKSGKLSTASATIQRVLAQHLPAMPPALPFTMPMPGTHAPAAKGPAPESPGDFQQHDFTCAAGARPYKLCIPARRTSRPGLIVMLHGCTQSPDDFAAGTAMNGHAEQGGFLVLYPAQISSANAQKCWNWFSPADQHRDAGEPAIIAGMTRHVIAQHRVDPKKVYVAGLSAGGALAALLADAYPDLFAAAGVHSGLPPGSATDMPSAFRAMRKGPPVAAHKAATPVRTIIFHGDQDSTVNHANADAIAAYLTGHAPRPPIDHPGAAPGGHTYTKRLYRSAKGLVIVEQWTIHGAGHAWSGGKPAGSYTDARGPDASAEMVRFFGDG